MLDARYLPSLAVTPLDILHQWQTLVGATIGVFAAALSAILLVLLRQWDNRRTAAHFVYLELMRFRNVMETVQKIASEAAAALDDQDATESFQLNKNTMQAANWFPLSPTFRERAARLAPADMELGLELSIVQTFYDGAESRIRWYLKALEEKHIHNGKPSGSLTRSMMESGIGLLQDSMDHAETALSLLESMYFHWYSPFVRARRRIFQGRILRRRARSERQARPDPDDGEQHD